MKHLLFGQLRQLRRDVVLYALVFGVTQLLNLVLLPVLTRVLSIEEFGVVDVVALVVSFASVAIGLSLPSALARYFNEVPASELGSVATTLLAAVALCGLVLVPLLSMLAPSLSLLLFSSQAYSSLLQLALGIALLQAFSSIPEMLLRLQRRIPTFAATQIVLSIAYLVLTLVLVLGTKRGVHGVFEAQLYARLLALALTLVLARPSMSFRSGFRHVGRSLRFSLPQLPGLLIGWASPQLNRILLLSLGNLTAVAIYGVAARLARLSSAAGTVFGNAWQPFSMLLVNDVRRNEIYSQTFNLYAVGMAALGISITALGPELVSLLVPVSYGGATFAIPWLIGGQALRQTVMFTRLGVLLGERTYLLSLATTLGVIVNLALGLMLIPSLQVTGAAISFFLSGVLQTSSLAWLAGRVSDVRFDVGFLFRLLTFYSLSTTALLFLAALTMPLVSIAGRAVVLSLSIAVTLRWFRQNVENVRAVSPEDSDRAV